MSAISLSSRVRHAVVNGRETGTVWVFETARFQIRLEIERDWSYRYDGDDENGKTQAALDSGDLVAFDSRVVVELDGVEIASDSLGGSVYATDDIADFWRGHRSADPLNRNCSLMRAARGDNVVICHYFPDMVVQAVAEARRVLRGMRDVKLRA